jgi:hypothetical protein
VGRSSGEAEIYVVSSADSQIHRAVYSATTGMWSSWSTLTGVGAARLAGAPAAVALDASHTELLAASTAGNLVATTGFAPGTADGSWQTWRTISAAGTVKPGVAYAARADGTQAAFVIRSSDLVVLRLLNSGSSSYNYNWGSSFSTGAVGQPEASFISAGKPYLFVQSASDDVQVYEPSGATLRGAQTVTSAGVTSHNPPGVAALPDQRLIIAVTAHDGSVRLYASTV